MALPLDQLNLTNPVLAAPMAGGPSTPALVVAAAAVGSFGQLAGGYKTPQLLAEQITEVRRRTDRFGVNLFAPNPVPVDPAAFRRYAAAIAPVAETFGIDLSAAEPVEDDDHWADKIALLIDDPVAVVSFTFGIPDPATITALRRAGTITIQTVTSVDEALLAEAAGVDVLAVQASAAGGHSATLTPDRPPASVPLVELLAAIRALSPLPMIGAGGLSTAPDVAVALANGADAVMVGTALLRTDESGASAVHRAAIADPQRGDTVLTRAFTGRPARALPNAFIREFGTHAPSGYPALHHLTSGLRRAAAAAGDPEYVHLWAGAGYRKARPGPAAAVLSQLAAGVTG